jgi:hypothetical protein
MVFRSKELTMKCPRCKTPDLRPTLIEEYLPAMGCDTCHGSLVRCCTTGTGRKRRSLLRAPDEATIPPDPVATNDTTTAIICPKCARVMQKYKLTGTVANRVDVCSTCDEGLARRRRMGIAGSAAARVTSCRRSSPDHGSGAFRREQSEGTRRAILVRMIGEDGATRVEEFRDWLARNQHKSHVLAYLYGSKTPGTP